SAIGIPVSGGERQGKAGANIDYHLHTRPRERAGPDQGLTNQSAAELTAAAQGQCCHAKVWRVLVLSPRHCQDGFFSTAKDAFDDWQQLVNTTLAFSYHRKK